MSSLKIKKKKPNRKKVAKAIARSLKRKAIGDEPQFRMIVEENGKILSDEKLFDPFIRSEIKIKGWKAAWIILRKGITYRVHIGGTREAVAVVFDGDYKALPPAPATPNAEATEPKPNEAVQVS